MFRNYLEAIEYALPLLNQNPTQDELANFKYLTRYALFTGQDRSDDFSPCLLRSVIACKEDVSSISIKYRKKLLTDREFQVIGSIAEKFLNLTNEEISDAVELINYIVEQVFNTVDKKGLIPDRKKLLDMSIQSVFYHSLTYMECLPHQNDGRESLNLPYYGDGVDKHKIIVDRWLNSLQVTHYLDVLLNSRFLEVILPQEKFYTLYYTTPQGNLDKEHSKDLSGPQVLTVVQNPLVTLQKLMIGGVTWIEKEEFEEDYSIADNPYLLTKCWIPAGTVR